MGVRPLPLTGDRDRDREQVLAAARAFPFKGRKLRAQLAKLEAEQQEYELRRAEPKRARVESTWAIQVVRIEGDVVTLRLMLESPDGPIAIREADVPIGKEWVHGYFVDVTWKPDSLRGEGAG